MSMTVSWVETAIKRLLGEYLMSVMPSFVSLQVWMGHMFLLSSMICTKERWALHDLHKGALGIAI
jgi:hypothetical protein